MKTLMIKLGSLLLTLTLANAEIAIYQQAYVQTQTGGGTVINTVFGGYFLFDNKGSSPVQIDVSSKSKSFEVWTYSTSSVNYLRTATGQTLLISIPMFDTGKCYMKGRASSLSTGNQDMTLPKSMTMSGTCVSGTDPDAEAYDFKGKLTFNSKATVAANLAGNEITNAVATLKASLLAKGYTEIE